LFELHGPLASILVPIAAYDLGIECHIFSKTKGLADLIEIFPDVWRMTGISRPIWTVMYLD
jgi:hypothetical protein